LIARLSPNIDKQFSLPSASKISLSGCVQLRDFRTELQPAHRTGGPVVYH